MAALFEPSHSNHVKAWLTKELGPICDAEPDVLADYVIALLKHDASEADLSALLNEQLADFLDDKTGDFVSSLVSTLATKSYLPADQRPASSASGSAAPPAASRKRPADDDGGDAPTKAARASDGAAINPPRGPAADLGEGSTRERDVRERSKDRSAGPSGSGAQHQQQRKPKDLCRDFHNKGFCSRGDNCRYEHSTDAITGGMNGRPMPQGFMGMPPQQMHMGPGGPQFNNNARGSPGGAASPPGPGGYTGPPPPMAMGFPMQFPSQWNGQGGSPGHMGMPGFPGPQHGAPFQGGPDGNNSANLANRLGEQQPQAFGNMGHSSAGAPQRGGFNGRGGRGGGRGGGMAGHFQSRARSTTTLVIENVPADSLDLIKINDYFKKFGTITNIQIDQPASKALVSYSEPAEAKAAHDSPDVIFGNRFVKVYFQKLDEPLEQGAAPTPRPPPQPRQTFAAGQNVYRPPGSNTPAPGAESAQSGPRATPEQLAERKAALDHQRQAQDKVNQLLTEQKQLLVKVSSSATTPEDKKAAMASFKALEPQIKEATEEVRKAVQTVQALPSLPSAGPAASGGFDPSRKNEQRERMERERLDRELEAHSGSANITAEASADASGNGSSSGGQTAELRAKLAALKAEASALGIDQAGGHSRGGYRGRARGGPSYHRGGGGRGGGSMRLDLRPTKLNVQDIPAGKEAQRVKEWLKSFGEVASFDDEDGSAGGDVAFAVTFKQHYAADQAVRSLAAPDYEVPDVGKVKLTWASTSTQSGQPGSAGGAPSTSAANGSSSTSQTATAAAGGDDDDENWKR